MNNRIVIEPAFKIREIARNALAGYWPRMYLGIFLYFVILSGMMIAFGSILFHDRQCPCCRRASICPYR